MEEIRIWTLDVVLQDNNILTTTYEANASMNKRSVMNAIRDEVNKNFIIVKNTIINVSTIKYMTIKLEGE